MAFGPRMQLSIPQKEGDALQVELAPLTVEALSSYIAEGGMQDHTVTKFLNRRTAPTLEDEQEWYEKTRKDETSVSWGVWLVADKDRQLIGGTSLNSLEHGPTGLKQVASGVLLFKPHWGKSIASHIHRARTWYAFSQLGITRIKSAVIHGNVASLKALEVCGYTHLYIERNTAFVDGRLHHQDNLECINPLEPFWGNWWNGEAVPEASTAARKRTLEAMNWAKENVKLP